MTLSIHTVTTTVIGRHARGEARYLRQHTGPAPEPIAPLRPLWQDIAAGVLLLAFIGACVFV